MMTSEMVVGRYLSVAAWMSRVWSVVSCMRLLMDWNTCFREISNCCLPRLSFILKQHQERYLREISNCCLPQLSFILKQHQERHLRDISKCCLPRLSFILKQHQERHLREISNCCLPWLSFILKQYQEKKIHFTFYLLSHKL